MTSENDLGIFGENKNGRIAVLIEDHFDQTEFEAFNAYFPTHGYQIVYVTHLWNNPSLFFRGNPDDGVIRSSVTVTTELADLDPSSYAGVLLIGAYAMDRLRYDANPKKGAPNQAPAVALMRQVMQTPGLKVGTICHALWLLCADRSLLSGRRVTCAHNIICDVENAGADVVFEGEGTAELVIDGDLITGKHPGMIDRFVKVFHEEIEKMRALPA
jgi:putative intracellular protease/amidase